MLKKVRKDKKLRDNKKKKKIEMNIKIFPPLPSENIDNK